MKTATIAILLGTAILAVGLACNDSSNPEDTLTLEEYFAQMDSLRESSDADYEAVHDVWEEQAREVPAGVSLLVLQRERIHGLVEVMNTIGTELEQIAVPDQARPAHSAYAAALYNYADAMAVYAATDSDEGLRDPIARLHDACSDLQTVAEENSLEADPCSDGTVRLVNP